MEQHRRLKAKQYFDQLRCLVPTGRDPKNDRNKVLSLAIEHLRSLLAGKDVTAKGTSMEPTGDLIFSMDADEVQQAKCEEATVQAKTDDSSKAGEALSEADKRLSHNEVEQKRRQEARHRYDELRALLPNASKFDKNTVLQHTIQAIQELAGVSDQALSKMMSELPVCDADNEGDSMVDSSASNAISAAASGLAQLASAGHKSCFLFQPAATTSPYVYDLCTQDEVDKILDNRGLSSIVLASLMVYMYIYISVCMRICV